VSVATSTWLTLADCSEASAASCVAT
jgi:hypothetical protein